MNTYVKETLMGVENIMVSVLCTAYNHGLYLRETIEKIVSQKTDFKIELLINDDVSSDNTVEIIREYAEKYPDIIVPFYQEKNLYSQGISIYSHVFYPRVRGKYIAFCEGDDYWCDDTKLQQQVDFLEAHPDYAACMHNSVLRICGGSGEPDKLLVPEGEDHDVSFETICSGLNNAFHTSSFCIRSEIVLDVQEFTKTAEKYRFMDYPLAIWTRMNGKIRFIDKAMSVYRINSNPNAWSSGVNGAYDRHKEFLEGEVEMFRALMPLLEGEQLEVVKRILLEREFEMLYVQGRDKELVKPPYLEIYKKKGFGFRAKQFVKRTFPFVQKLHRKRKNYGN